jgi:hypothetical protein
MTTARTVTMIAEINAFSNISDPLFTLEAGTGKSSKLTVFSRVK